MSVDDVDASRLSLTDILRMFERPRALRLVLRRGAAVVRVTLLPPGDRVSRGHGPGGSLSPPADLQ